jgi:hypothetical protein
VVVAVVVAAAVAVAVMMVVVLMRWWWWWIFDGAEGARNWACLPAQYACGCGEACNGKLHRTCGAAGQGGGAQLPEPQERREGSARNNGDAVPLCSPSSPFTSQASCDLPLLPLMHTHTPICPLASLAAAPLCGSGFATGLCWMTGSPSPPTRCAWPSRRSWTHSGSRWVAS